MQKWRKPATVLMSWDVIIAKSSKSAHTFAPLTSVCRNGLNPQGSYPLHPLMREQSGGCESADHPNLPARPREMCCLFGSGSSGLGYACGEVRRRPPARHPCANPAQQPHTVRGAVMTTARLKHFGWGREGEGMTPEEEAFVLGRHRARFGVERFDERPPPRLADLVLPPPRLVPPAALASCCSSETYDRAAHTYGKSFVDTVRGLEGDYASAPDVVAWPRDETDVAAVMDWAGGAQAVVTPFGGGSSVVGGVESRVD